MVTVYDAGAHALVFRYHDDPELTPEEAQLHDLLALHRVVVDLARRQRDLLGFYGPEPVKSIS